MNRLLCRLMYLNINVLQNYGKDVISQIATAYRNCDPKTKSRRARGSMSRRRSQQEQTSEGLLPSPMHKSVSTIDAASGSFKHPQLQRAGSTAAGLAFGRRASSTLSTLGSDAEEVTSNSSLSLSPHSTLIQEVGDILREQSNDFGSSLSSASAQSSGDLVANMMATLAVQKANMAAPFWSETAGLFSSPFGAQEPNNPRPDGQPMHMELFAHANTPPVGLVPGISLTSHHSDEWVNWDSA